LLDAAGLQFEGEEIELVLVLLQPVHFELETGVSVDEWPGLMFVLGERRPCDSAPNGALVKLGVEKLGRLSQKFHALERSFPLHLRIDEAARSKKFRASEVGYAGEGSVAEQGEAREGRAPKVGSA